MKPHEVNKRLSEWLDLVVVDNDFERAYQIPFEKFKDISREDLIETLFVMRAILSENEILLPEPEEDDEPANRQFPDM